MENHAVDGGVSKKKEPQQDENGIPEMEKGVEEMNLRVT